MTDLCVHYHKTALSDNSSFHTHTEESNWMVNSRNKDGELPSIALRRNIIIGPILPISAIPSVFTWKAESFRALWRTISSWFLLLFYLLNLIKYFWQFLLVLFIMSFAQSLLSYNELLLYSSHQKCSNGYWVYPVILPEDWFPELPLEQSAESFYDVPGIVFLLYAYQTKQDGVFTR